MISLKVNKANIIVEQKEILTSQRVGLKVHFEFSKEWDELNKIVVCQSGKISRGTVLDENNNCIVPTKVLLNNGQDLLISVRGYNINGDIVIPSIYANLGEIRLGSNITNLNFDSETPTHELLEEIMLRLIPKGGSKNQVLAKKSDNEYEFEWQDSANVYNSISKLDDYLYEVVYLDTDDEYAREYFLQRKPEVSPGACSSFIHYDNNKRKFIRFFDWVYNNNVEFIVKTPARDGKYAVEGVAGGTLGLTKDLVENGKYSELYKILPYYMTDGHNEHGLVISTNVVPLQKGKTIGTIPKREVRDQICTTMLVRYLLEKCKTAEEAVTLIDNYVSVYSNASLHNLNYEQHFLISDNKKCYCLEFVENTVRILEKNAITNFYLADTTVQGNQHYNTPLTAINGEYASNQGVTSHGSGLERYNIIRDSRNERVEELIPKLLYTNAYYPHYDEELDTTWYSEFVGEENGQELTVDNIPSDFKGTIDKYYDIFINRSRDTANTWQSLHVSIYDFFTNTFQIYVQENLNKKFDIKFNYPTMEKFVNELYTIDYSYNLYLSAQQYQKPTETTKETYIAKKMGYNPLKKDNKIFWFDIDSEDPNCVLKIFKDDNNEWRIQGQNDSAGKNRFLQVNFGSQMATFYANTQKNFSNIYALYDEELIEIESEQDLHNLLAFNNSRLFLIAKSGDYWEIVKNKAKTNNSSLQTSSFKIETYTLDDIIEEIKNNYDDYGINLHAIPVSSPVYNEKYLRLSDSPIRKANKYNSAMLGDDINSHNSKNSLAIGSNLTQNNNNSLVIGQFNEKGNLPFVIGFGNNNNKKDILEINNGGNGTFGGNVISNNDVTCKNTYNGDTIISLRENGNKINEVWHGEYKTLIGTYQYGINFIDGTAIAPIAIPVELKADDNFIITIAKNKMSLKGNYFVTANDVENGVVDSQEINGIIGSISYISLSNKLFYKNIQDEDGNLLNGIYYGSIYYISYKDPKPFKRISIIESPKNSTDGVNKKYVDDTVDGISAKIPAQASTTNQLADKDFVNSSIENVAAYFITKDANGNPFATKAELDAATVFYSGGQVRVPTRNDYTVVLHDESKLIGEEAPTTRYLYFNGWNYQYTVNNSGLTADQWKAVNSGATAEIIESVVNKQDKLTAGDGVSIDENNVISAEKQVLIVTADFNYGNMTISNASHTFAEIAAAYDAGKAVFLKAGRYEFEATTKSSTFVQFSAPTDSKTYIVTSRSSGVWSVSQIEKVNEITDSATNTQYPSALAVINYVNSVIGNVSAALSTMDAVIGGDEP